LVISWRGYVAGDPVDTRPHIAISEYGRVQQSAIRVKVRHVASETRQFDKINRPHQIGDVIGLSFMCDKR
jgi:hypothetical protein